MPEYEKDADNYNGLEAYFHIRNKERSLRINKNTLLLFTA
jgi:hypothetical protein